MWRVLGLAVVTGCAFQPAGGGDPDAIDGGGDDATLPDPDGGGTCTSAAAWLDTCALPPSGPGLSLGATGTYTYDTDDGELRNPGGTVVAHTSVVVATATGDVRVLLVDNVMLAAASQLRATGALPFVIVATGDISIAGTLDVGHGGAGARGATACGDSAGGGGAENSGGGGGGGGGGFGASGATGGIGNSDGATQAEPGKGGVAAGDPTGPLGGCPGGRGGTGNDPGGRGGIGGGALYLVSSTAVRIPGIVDAGGEGGRGGTDEAGGNADAGGGGGGSGGMIAIDAPVLQAPGIVTANGGGGGEGSGNGTAGMPGQPGQRSIVAALGGSGGSISGSDGSAGGALATPEGAEANPAQQGGGGGGGGGVGMIIFRSPAISVGAAISPAPR